MRVTRIALAVVLGVAFVCLAVTSVVAEEEKVVTPKKVEMKDLPKAVQKTIRKEAGDNKVTEIVEMMVEDEKVYQAKWMDDDKTVVLQVSARGEVVSKKVEGEDEDGDIFGGDDAAQ